MFAVTHGLQDTDKIIIEDKSHRPQEIDPEISDGIGEYICRSFHQNQNLWSKKETEDRQENS